MAAQADEKATGNRMVRATVQKMAAHAPDQALDGVMDSWNTLGAVPKQSWLAVSAAPAATQTYSASSLMLGNTSTSVGR